MKMIWRQQLVQVDAKSVSVQQEELLEHPKVASSQPSGSTPQRYPRRFRITQPLVEGGIPFYFDFDVHEQTVHEYEQTGERSNTGLQTSLLITTNNGFRQELDNVSQTWVWPSDCYVTDFNFDGYRDLICLYSMVGRVYRYHGWVWSPEQERFAPVEVEQVLNGKTRRQQPVRNGASGYIYS